MMEIESNTIQQAQAGDKQAFGRLVVHYAKAVNGLAYRYTADASLAEDIAQDTFIKAHKALPKYRPQALFSTWLLTITTNTAIDYLRKMKRQPQNTGLSIDQDHATGSLDLANPGIDHSDQLDLQHRLSRAMASLNDDERVAITMKHHQGYSIAETAKALNLKDNACKQTIFRAVQKLRKQLATEVRL